MGTVKILDDCYKSRSIRIYEDYAPTLRKARIGFKVLYIGNKEKDSDNNMYGIISNTPKVNKIPLSINELFSGIGAQYQGIKNTGLFECTVVNTADIAKDSIVSYAAIHNGLTPKVVETYKEQGKEPDLFDMITYLNEHNIGYNFEESKPCDWLKCSKDVKKYYVACKLSHNIGDIAKIDRLDYADLWTYSFPCTDISIAGEQKGIIKGVTRSGLLYEVERLLKVAKQTNTLPKYLLLENVKHLLSKAFKSVYDDWVRFLNDLGYVTYTAVLNAKDCGIPQNRERVFAISIRKDIANNEFMFPMAYDTGLRLKDIIDKEVDSKYDCTEESLEYLYSNEQLGDIKGLQKGDYVLRRLTPNECWRLMGFDDKAFNRVCVMGVSDTKLYEQAGNSIVTNCIELLFEHLYKAQYDISYVTTDECLTNNIISWCIE